MKCIPADSITQLDEYIYTGTKLVCDKISNKESEQKHKTWIGNEERRTIKETATTYEITKGNETYRSLTERKDPQKITTDKSDNTRRRNKSKDISERRETQKIPGYDQGMKTKQDIPK